MEDDEYELVSSEEVDRLKREIEHLKSNPFVQSSSDLRLYDAVKSLNESVSRLCVLFENVNKQLMKEYQEGDSPEAKLDRLLEQNKNIAEALVTFVSKNEQQEPSQIAPLNQNEPPIPAMQEVMQIPQANSYNNQQGNMQFSAPNQQYTNQSMGMNMQPQMQSVFPQGQPQAPSNFGFNGRIDPNYPTPDAFKSVGTPAIGEPINIEPKRKSFLGIGKK